MITFFCANCQEKYEVEDSDIDVENIGSYERQMGNENEYSIVEEFDCNKCGNHIKAEFNFWEYPMGALNYSEYSEEGCIITEEPDYQKLLISDQEQDYEN